MSLRRPVLACAPVVLAALVTACGARTGLPVGDDEGGGGGGAGPHGCALGESVACYSGPPGTSGVGRCRAGVRVCLGESGFGPCTGEVLPGVELCNQLDDDCDGALDGPACIEANGCADGTREGFVDEAKFPDIAACAGGFDVPGVLSELAAACGRSGGDDSANPNGAGCSAEDLCSEGFAVCPSASAVASCSKATCAGLGNEPGVFFVTRQSSTGCGLCATGQSVDTLCASCACAGDCKQTDATSNDIFGCGTVGDTTAGCGVLDRFSNDVCSTLPAPWSCGGDGCAEAHAVIKPGPAAGGALCCRVGCE